MIIKINKLISKLVILLIALLLPSSMFSQSFISDYAGSGESGMMDGSRSKASFSLPMGMTFDKDGSILVADSYNNRIRRISDTGVSTVAGSHDRLNVYGFPLAGYFDGDAAKAKFNNPKDVAVDSKGTIYVADSGNNTVRKVTGGKVYTLTGTGKAGYMDGAPSKAMFNGLSGIAVDQNSNLYVADSLNNVVRRITPTGEVSTVAGKYQQAGGYKDGIAVEALFNEPSDVAVGKDGSLYILDCGNQLVRKLSNGKVTTISGKIDEIAADTGYAKGSFTDGSSFDARFNFPKGITVTDDGIVFVADTWNHRIRAIKPDGSVISVAGTGTPGKSNSTQAEASLNGPVGLLYRSGSLYISDMWNNSIRVVAINTDNLTQVVDIDGITFDKPTNEAQVWMDKNKLAFTDVQPYYIDDNTMVPLRAVCEKWGAKVTAKDNQILVEKDGETYSFDIQKDQINNKNGTAVIHIRKLAERLGFKVDWISKYNAVVISTK